MDPEISKAHKNVSSKAKMSFTEAIDMTTKRVTTMHEKLVAFTNSVNDNESTEEQTKKFLELHREYKLIRRLCLLINKSGSVAEEQEKELDDLQRRLDLKRDLLERLNEVPKKLKQVNPGENVIVPERKTFAVEEDDILSVERDKKLLLGSELEMKKEKVMEKLLEIQKIGASAEENKTTHDVQASSSSTNLRDLLNSNSK